MRHGIAGNKLGRKSAHRKATVRDIAKAVLLQQRISTTKAKAKEARKLVEKLITMGKNNTLAEKRRAFAVLCNHKLVSDLFMKIAPRFNQRKGGYTRIIPCGNRRGDNAEMVFFELTEKEEVIVSKPKAKKADVKKVAGETASAKDENKIEKKEVAPKDEKVTKPKLVKDETVKKKAPDKSKKNIVGGIKNIFRRKSSDK